MLPPRILKRIVFDDSGCWLWQGASLDGYGWLGWNKKADRAHRVIYKILIGPIPENTELHHICENRACCNPNHLKPVTRKAHRALHPVKAPPTHCKNGHPFEGENVVLRITPSHPKGQRQCRTCLREAFKRYRNKNSSGRPPGRPKVPVANRPTHCLHGHKYTEQNTYVAKDGARYCRICGSERAKRRYHNKHK